MGAIVCAVLVCVYCGCRPDAFKFHGVRSRIILLVVQSIAERIQTYLTRWKCPLCGHTFTLYPDWALAHKRYEASFILERCKGYVSEDACSYRKGVMDDGLPIFHEDAEECAQLSPSSLWHWVSTLGEFVQPMRQALHLIRQKAPSSGLFRTLGTLRIGAHKYRSEARRQTLERCLSLLLISQVYAHLFGGSLFPEFATGSGFR